MIGEAPSEKLAFGKLQKELKKDLSASGGVIKSGQKIEATKGINKEFRLGKNNPMVLVQRSGSKKEGGIGRLSTFGEVSEIQRAKKKKSKKIKWFS